MVKGTVASAKITAKGQITIPKEVREVMGVKEGDSVVFMVEDGKAYLHAFPRRDLMSLAGGLRTPVPYRGKAAEKAALAAYFAKKEEERLKRLRSRG